VLYETADHVGAKASVRFACADAQEIQATATARGNEIRNRESTLNLVALAETEASTGNF
jgi:hypothetical protein